jgi:hypothetical protein
LNVTPSLSIERVGHGKPLVAANVNRLAAPTNIFVEA